MDTNSNDNSENTQIDTVNDTEAQEKNTSSADVVLNLEALIKQHLSGIDKGKQELKKFREMISSVLINDETYSEQEKLAKEAQKLKSSTKSQLMKQQSVNATVIKAKELALEIKELENGLSDYLREYHRLSGSSEIETDDGQVRDIVYTAKLIKRGSVK